MPICTPHGDPGDARGNITFRPAASATDRRHLSRRPVHLKPQLQPKDTPRAGRKRVEVCLAADAEHPVEKYLTALGKPAGTPVNRSAPCGGRRENAASDSCEGEADNA